MQDFHVKSLGVKKQQQQQQGEVALTTYFPRAYGLSKTTDLDFDGEILQNK